MECANCGAQARVLNVNENAPEGVAVTYICANRRCVQYEQEIGEEILPKTES